jgi:hypothetical protein
MATVMLVSALAIPIISRTRQDDDKIKNSKLVGFLLYDSQVPTRESLLQFAVSCDLDTVDKRYIFGCKTRS